MTINRGRGSNLRGMTYMFAGVLLMLVGIGLIALTVHGLIGHHAATSRHGGEVVDLGDDARPQAGLHGAMVRVVGTPTVVEAPHDAEFNLRVDTPVLVRHVEMFQWREVRIGATVHYELDWVDRLLDARAFKQPAGHANPAAFPLSGQRFDAGQVTVGGFKLSPLLLDALPGSGTVTPNLKSLPENLAASFSQHGHYLVTSTRPDDPRLGDIRVSWELVPLRVMTIVARVDGDRLVPAVSVADDRGFHVEIGDVSLFDMFPDLPIPPAFVWGRSILAVLMAALGAFLLRSIDRRRSARLKPRVLVLEALLALALGTLTVGAVASMLWLGHDTTLMAAWLLLALLGAAISIGCLRYAKAAAAA